MHALLIAAALAVTPVATFSVPGEAAAALAEHVTTGTLLLSDGDCLAVKVFTASRYTHVAGIVVEKGEPFVYDSQNGVGVRKQTLAEYLDVTRPDELHILHPAKPFDARRAERFRNHLEEQIGRPYEVTHHLTGNRCDGLHCAEYMTDALIAADLIHADRPPRVSPASLRSGLLRHRLYDEGKVLEIASFKHEREPGRCWCEELWLDTKDCCVTCWLGFRRTVFCR